jgi:hypothetical protein
MDPNDNNGDDEPEPSSQASYGHVIKSHASNSKIGYDQSGDKVFRLTTQNNNKRQ